MFSSRLAEGCLDQQTLEEGRRTQWLICNNENKDVDIRPTVNNDNSLSQKCFSCCFYFMEIKEYSTHIHTHNIVFFTQANMFIRLCEGREGVMFSLKQG